MHRGIASKVVGLSIGALAVCKAKYHVNAEVVEKRESINPKLWSKDAVDKSRLMAEQVMQQGGVPGMVLGVSWKGVPVWVQGFGLADVELGVRCNESTVMRIASISKSITMLAVAKLIEEGKLDLDKDISYYLKDRFPAKTWEGKKVEITLRQLAAHLGGIRHYKFPSKDNSAGPDSKSEEFARKTPCKDVNEALSIFKDDQLVAKPGSKFKYTTYGYTLISAVVEQVLPKDTTFGTYLVNKLCRNDLGLTSTYLDQHEPIILNRAKYYVKNSKNGKLQNAPYVDNSCKWSGGGLLSSVPDLLQFANVMMYSFSGKSNGKGYLKRSTVDTLWSPMTDTEMKFGEKMAGMVKYGLGWVLVRASESKYAGVDPPPFDMMVWHTGDAMGASSILLIVPEEELVVAAICNLGSFNLGKLALYVAKSFAQRILEDNEVVDS